MNKQNLLALADYLQQVVTDDEFDMDEYAELPFCEAREMHSCGSVGCMIGHAIAIFPAMKNDRDWLDYESRVFQLTNKQSSFAFSSTWAIGSGHQQRLQGIARLRFLATASFYEIEKAVNEFFYDDVMNDYC